MRRLSKELVGRLSTAVALSVGAVAFAGTAQADQHPPKIDKSNPFTPRIESEARQLISMAKSSQSVIKGSFLNYFDILFANPNSSGGADEYTVATDRIDFKASQLRWFTIAQSGPHEANFILEISVGDRGKWNMYCSDNPDAAMNSRR